MGIFQARILEWVAISFSKGSSWPRDWTRVSYTAGRCFTIWATREIPTIGRSHQTHSHNIQFKIKGLELRIERSYQSHPHNIHFKMTGLVRRFLRRHLSSSRIHCCYIITGTEFKEKHILERDELFCYVIISSRRKEKTSVLFSSLRTPDLSLLLWDPGLLINLPRNWLSHQKLGMQLPRIAQNDVFTIYFILQIYWAIVDIQHCLRCTK